MKASEPGLSSKNKNLPAFWQCCKFSMKTPHQRSMITYRKAENCKRALDTAAIIDLLREEMHVKEIDIGLTSTRAWANVSVGHLMWTILWHANIREQLQTCWGKLNLALLSWDSFKEDLAEEGDLRSARSASLHLPKAVKNEMWSTDWTLLRKLVLCKVWSLLGGRCKQSWIDGKNRMKASEPEHSSTDRNVPASWEYYKFSNHSKWFAPIRSKAARPTHQDCV